MVAEYHTGNSGCSQQAVIKLQTGTLGYHRWLTDGILEIKNRKPLYRIYCGDDGNQLVILLTGGEKSNQQADIMAAYQYWKDYQQSKEDDNGKTE